MHSAKSQYIYFENNPFFYRQPVQISQHWCDRVKFASACDQSSGRILDFLKMTDGRCWQTIEKRIPIVKSRGYESMYQLLGGILRDVFSDVTDSFQMLEPWTPDIIDVFFKVHGWSNTIPKFLALVLDGTLSFPMLMCVVVIVLRKYGEAISKNSIFHRLVAIYLSTSIFLFQQCKIEQILWQFLHWCYLMS